MAGGRGIRAWGAVLLALLPAPTVAAAWGWVQVHPVAAALWTVAYEVMLFTASFVAGIINPVRDKWQQRLSDSLYQASLHRFRTFDRRYRTYVADRWESIDQRGLATGGFFTPALDDVFVDVSLTHRPPHAVPGDPLGDVPAGITERHSIWDFLGRPNRVLLAVVGGPGSGKTTLLRHTARQLCRRRKPRRLAVLLFLRDHAAAIAGDPTVTLAALLRGRLPKDLAAAEPEQWFESRLTGGEGVVLLDGLDEIAEAEHRKLVVDWVEQQVAYYSKYSFVVTSRPHGYEANPLNGFAVLQTRRLTDEQVGRFVHSWYLAAEKHSTSTNTSNVTMRATEQADDLLGRLRQAPALLDLTHNPLLLTMIANVHRYRGALPGSRADLYKEICEVLLWRRHEAKGLRSQLHGEQQIAVLREVAFHMMRQRLRDLPQTDLLSIFENALPRYSSDITANEFLTTARNNGLLVERENSTYAFAHLTFQEYLAAAHIHEARQPELLTAQVGDPWWRETILLYAAQADATPIVEACLAADTLPALALAFDCAATARTLAPECRHRLDRLMTEEIATTADPARRRLLAGVSVIRQLHAAIPVEGGGQVCTEPVTRAVYQLFLDETHHGEAAPPPTSLTESDPVATTGPWSRDALAFIDWLNEHICTEQPVRLPTQAELAHLPGNHRLQPTWATDQATPGTTVLWIPPGAPPRVDTAVLRQHLIQDLDSLAQLLPAEEIQFIDLLNQLNLDRDRERDRAIALDLTLDRALDLALDLARAIALTRDFDLARERSLHLALDLARAIALRLHLHLDLRLANDLANDLARERSLDRARHLARNLAANLDFARARNRTRSSDRRSFDLALDRVRSLDLTLHLDLALDLARERARDLARDLARDHALDLAGALARADADADAYVLDLDRALANARACNRALAHALYLDTRKVSIPSADRIGVVLSGAISAYHQAASSRRKDPEAEFSRATLQIVPDAPAAVDVRVDDVWDAIRTAKDALARPDSTWGSTVADRLLETARPIFNRDQPVTAHVATLIRLPALCLAVEAEQTLFAPELGLRFRELAAAITLLERYASGQQTPCETILLAYA